MEGGGDLGRAVSRGRHLGCVVLGFRSRGRRCVVLGVVLCCVVLCCCGVLSFLFQRRNFAGNTELCCVVVVC